MTPEKTRTPLATNIKEHRFVLNLTQAGPGTRSGLALATLRTFERSAGPYLVNKMFRLMLVFGGLEKVIHASALDPARFSSVDNRLSGKTRPKRKRGHGS